jgi:hypothetical protein
MAVKMVDEMVELMVVAMVEWMAELMVAAMAVSTVGLKAVRLVDYSAHKKVGMMIRHLDVKMVVKLVLKMADMTAEQKAVKMVGKLVA